MARYKRSGLFTVALAVTVWSAGAGAGIVSDWATLSGGLSAKVVYWDASAIRVLDLVSGADIFVLSVPDNYSEIAATPWPVWSPDGTKISYFRPDSNRSFWVVNEDGSNPTMVISGLNWDYGVHSWWSYPTVAGDWIVAQKNNVIVRVEVNADNTPGSTVNVLDFGEDVDWLGMSGNYVGFTDWSGHGAAGNACIVVNWVTSAQNDTVPLTDDACSMNIKQDGSGTSIYCHDSHNNAEVQTFTGTIRDIWSPIIGERIEMLRWSNHPDFICYNANRMTTPRADQYAWIRKLNNDVYTTGDYVFLGRGMWGPDVWVDTGPPPTYPPTCSISPNGAQIPQGGSVDFSATANDPDGGTIQSYDWDFDYDGTTFNQDDTGQTTSNQFNAAGTLTVALRVTDDESETGMATVQIVVEADTDGDGMPDWWEDEHGLDKTSGSDATGDPDTDNLENLEEYLAGTDPNDPDTDGDGILDGDDGDPLNGPPGLHGVGGGCSPAGGAPLALALAVLAVAFVRRR